MYPNILWLMTDEQRTDSLSCYGSAWAKSPYLDRYAREGVVFQNAVTPAPVCQPARTALLTGQYPNKNGVWYNSGGSKNSAPLRLLVPLFEEAGYRTASFGKSHYHNPQRRAFQTEYRKVMGDVVKWSGYNEKYREEDFGAVHYPPEPYPWILGGTFPETMEKKVETDVVRQSIQWLEDHPGDAPFFLRLSFNAPHTPVIPPYPFDQLIAKEDIRYPAQSEGPSSGSPMWISETLRSYADSAHLTDEQIRDARRYYYGETAYVDYQFGVLLEWMQERGLLDNTIVVFVSDHGTHIGDYGLVQKQTFYNSVVQVPYFFWYPRNVKQGVRIQTPVETISLLPTLLELAGLPLPDDCRDKSLAQVLRSGNEPVAAPVFSEFTLGSFGTRHEDKLVMVRDGRWKMSVCFNPEVSDGALYDLEADPCELTNLYEEPGHKETVQKLLGLIANHLGHQQSWEV
jgi:arylsulfatase A-like enzyme